MSRRPHVHCDYCQERAELVGGDVIYPHRPDLARQKYYRCVSCDAWVGCLADTTKPLGRVAKTSLRREMGHARDSFDRVCRVKMEIQGVSKSRARDLTKAWLADQMGLHQLDLNISFFDMAQCRRVIELCRQVLRGGATNSNRNSKGIAA